MSDLERRILPVEDVELRVDGDGNPKITGYAAKFGKWSEDLGGFREKIKKGAFDGVLGNDVMALKNHDPNFLLGRTTSGTLRLNTNSVGLQFELDVPNTTVGRDTLEEVRRKDITGASFAFTVAQDGDEWKRNTDGTVERTINNIDKLFDISPCVYPAYPDTTVAVRSLDKLKKEMRANEAEDETSAEIEEDTEKPDEIDRERQLEIEKKYRKAGRIINRNKSADV